MKLPPITAIRAFECAARLSNFTKAGDELGMTQAAVSYQIKILEDRLGFKLFLRKARKVELTAQGRQLSQATSEAFHLLERAFARARENTEHILTLSVLPTFCSNWLIPRLSDFQNKHPHLSVRIDSSPRLVDIPAGEADIGIRTGEGDWPGLKSHFLFPGNGLPLMSKQAYETFGPFEQPRDLLKLRLISDLKWWREWFIKAGDPGAPLPENPALELESQNMEVAAALATGDAAVMAVPGFFAREIEQGLLVSPFRVQLEGLKNWLVYDPSQADEPKIKAFRDWILFDPNSFCLNHPLAQR